MSTNGSAAIAMRSRIITLTNNQSPTSNVGIMLPDGMRNASTKNVRMKRKITSAPAIDFTFSQSVDGSARFALTLPRAAATLELFAGADRFLVDATLGQTDRGRGTAVGDRTVKCNYAAVRGRVSPGEWAGCQKGALVESAPL